MLVKLLSIGFDENPFSRFPFVTFVQTDKQTYLNTLLTDVQRSQKGRKKQPNYDVLELLNVRAMNVRINGIRQNATPPR
jgi:hypothetical protein